MNSVLDVIDNFLGEEDCLAALQLEESQWSDLCIELQRFYESWVPPEPIASSVFSGSWAVHDTLTSHGRTVVSNDLMLFERVVIHDPLEPYVSRHSIVQRPIGLPPLPDNAVGLAWVDVPAAKSGQKPSLRSAVYPPHAPAFMTISEVETFSQRKFESGRIRRALQELETWRPLIQMGTILLVPVMEITHRETPLIAREAEQSIDNTRDALASSTGLALTSFFHRGAKLSPGDAFSNDGERDHARLVSWVYTRELAITLAGGSIYAAEQDIDAALVQSILTGAPVYPVRQAIRDAIPMSLPGFRDVSISDIVAIRRDEEAFAELRHILTTILTNDIVELERLPMESRQKRLAEHLQDELGRIAKQARSSRVSVFRRFSPGMVKILAPIGALTFGAGDPTGIAFGLGPTLLEQILQRRRQNGNERAMAWIERRLSSEH